MGKQNSERWERYSVEPSRSYLKDELWQRTDYFNHGDLLNLTNLLKRAEDWIAKQMIRSAQERIGNGDSGSPICRLVRSESGVYDAGREMRKLILLPITATFLLCRTTPT